MKDDKNYIFDLHGTLVDICTDFWMVRLINQISIYSFVFTRFFRRYVLEETNTSFDRLFEIEKEARFLGEDGIHRRFLTV